jgi:hypothetical protein
MAGFGKTIHGKKSKVNHHNGGGLAYHDDHLRYLSYLDQRLWQTETLSSMGLGIRIVPGSEKLIELIHPFVRPGYLVPEYERSC